MAGAGGVSGTAVGLAVAGGLLAYAGLKDVPITQALRDVLTTGTLPVSSAAQAGGAQSAGPAGQTGSAIADDAMRYDGKVPYRWGGADPSGWDCSGFVTYVLHHDLGYSLPSNDHTVCMQFYGWSGARPVRAPEQVQAGDLVVWPTHMGIAISSTEMISAENPRLGTRVATFKDGGPIPYSAPTFLRVGTTPGLVH